MNKGLNPPPDQKQKRWAYLPILNPRHLSFYEIDMP